MNYNNQNNRQPIGRQQFGSSLTPKLNTHVQQRTIPEMLASYQSSVNEGPRLDTPVHNSNRYVMESERAVVPTTPRPVAPQPPYYSSCVPYESSHQPPQMMWSSPQPQYGPPHAQRFAMPQNPGNYCEPMPYQSSPMRHPYSDVPGFQMHQFPYYEPTYEETKLSLSTPVREELARGFRPVPPRASATVTRPPSSHQSHALMEETYARPKPINNSEMPRGNTQVLQTPPRRNTQVQQTPPCRNASLVKGDLPATVTTRKRPSDVGTGGTEESGGHKHARSETDVDNTTGARKFQARRKDVSTLRIFSGSVRRVLKWEALRNKFPCLFEVIGTLKSTRDVSGSHKELLLRDDAGPVLQVLFYEIDRPLPPVTNGQIVRVVGRLMSRSRLQAYSLRVSSSEECSSLQRIAYICQRSASAAMLLP